MVFVHGVKSSISSESKMAKSDLSGIVMVGLCLFFAAAATAADDGMGYTDTPRLPNSPWRVHDRARPQPPMVAPGDAADRPAPPPSDAIVLFDGKNLSQWDGLDRKHAVRPADPKGIEQGCINIVKTGWLQTKKRFGDCQFHIEWATPEKADGNTLNWGNSGIFFMGKFELQIIESHDSKIYADGIAGAIYGQTPPLVNASRKPGQWQMFDVVFTAPRFKGDKLAAPAYMTVFWNGLLVQDHTEIMGATQNMRLPAYDFRETTGPIQLQQHNSAVRFRNIWIRPLTEH
jgi:hypothetical protein